VARGQAVRALKQRLPRPVARRAQIRRMAPTANDNQRSLAGQVRVVGLRAVALAGVVWALWFGFT